MMGALRTLGYRAYRRAQLVTLWSMRRRRLSLRATVGDCPICEHATVFMPLHDYARDGYLCARCLSIPRFRALATVLAQARPDWRRCAILEASPAGALSEKLQRECAGYVAASYYSKVPRGTIHRGSRSEDLEALTFADQSFDLVITQDVFEHVMNPARAFAEIARVLRPGGAHVFTVPWYHEQVTRRRAHRVGAGPIVHDLPAEYHADPVEGDGSLVVHDWGSDFPALVAQWSGLPTSVHSAEQRTLGIIGQFIDVFVSRKAPLANTVSGPTIGRGGNMQARVWSVATAGGAFGAESRPRPTVREHEVLVRIAASGVNPLDAKIRQGQAAHARQPLPAVLGLDMAGTVAEVGARVQTFAVGDEVYGMVGGVGGLQGTLAEWIAVDAELLAHKPKNLSMREAAALPLIAITAWEGLVDRAQARPNQRVLVHAGAGGVGHIAVQIARALGAQVFATVSPDKRHYVEQLGATPIDYKATSVNDYVAAHTAGEGFDVVYDTVGGATLDASFNAVKRYTGHVVSCLGWGSHSLAPLSFRGATYSGVFTLMPLISNRGRAHHGEILAAVAALAEAGKLRPFMHQRRFTTADIDAAHAQLAAGAVGKIVVDINDA